MRANFNVNTDGMQSKLRVNVNAIVRQMVIDGGEYLARKIREDIISGQIVGVITGNLRAGTHVEDSGTHVNVVSDMSYTQHVLEWSKGKYGQSYMELAIQLYGGNVITTIQQEAKNIYKKNYVYKNPFP